MNKILKLFSAIALVCLLLPACSKEDPFHGSDKSDKTGEVSFRKMVVEVNNDVNEVRASEVNVGEFLVEVTSTSGSTEYAGTYAEMPEVITLPVGDYTVTVKSPSNPDAAWDTPYYEGTQKFTVVENEVTFVDPVVCKIGNIKVTVLYDSKLLPYMEDDCMVSVQTGIGARLDFAKDEKRSGNFRYVEGEGTATLVATFKGTVDENYEENLRTYTDVAPGNHYIITYTIKTPSGQEPDRTGTVNPGIEVDATVEVVNMNANIDVEDDYLADTDRPQQGDKNGGNNQGGDQPNPPVTGNAPTVTATIGGSQAQFGTPIEVVDDLGEIKIYVTSEAAGGFTQFSIDIDSTTLGASLLEDPSVGLSTHLDLINPGSCKVGLTKLGLPVEIGGWTEGEFDITNFVPLLGIYGAGDHKFIVTVSDAYGTTTRTLYFVTKNQ
ncbi:MAG: DUF4493 domain-containing protein [Muribaculaceae bacterium]|nr:DUF4493 domain-containing protein [Muribaculaceae bacterium]